MTQSDIIKYASIGIGLYLLWNYYNDFNAKAYVKKNITDVATLAKIPAQFGGTATV